MKLYEHADWVLRVSIYTAGRILKGLPMDEEMVNMKKGCRLYSFFGHRKSPEYRWSNSGGEDDSIRPSKWIYDNILSKFGIDPYKGLNHDQYRAYFIYLFLKQDWESALKIMIGFIFRLGFTPSMTEHILFKPQAHILLLKVKFPFNIQYLWYPLYLISLLFFKFSCWRNLRIPISIETTNKISLIPTMKCLKMKLPSEEYVSSVYDTYWWGDDEASNMIRNSIKEGLFYEEEKK